MWSEVISIFGGTIALTGGYFGIYKLGWYISRKEQIDNFTKMIDDLKEQQDTHDDLIIKYEEHLVKLKEHSVYKNE
tara:strand:+ start:320 stop:547 length:228 start_codon:yes stop_codon:yes gene_type:complete